MRPQREALAESFGPAYLLGYWTEPENRIALKDQPQDLEDLWRLDQCLASTHRPPLELEKLPAILALLGCWQRR